MLRQSFSAFLGGDLSKVSSAIVLSTVMSVPLAHAHAGVVTVPAEDTGHAFDTMIGGALENGETANEYVSVDPTRQIVAVMSPYPDHVDFSGNQMLNWVRYQGDEPVTIDLSNGWGNGNNTGDAKGDIFDATNGLLGFVLVNGGAFTGSTNKEYVVMEASGVAYESGGDDAYFGVDQVIFQGYFAEYKIENETGYDSVTKLSDGTKVTLTNVARVTFADGEYDLASDEAIVERSINGTAVDCYVWRPDVLDYPAGNGANCITFEQSNNGAVINQSEGKADIGADQYSFDSSFAVIGTGAVDYIDMAAGGLVSAGSGVVYPKENATIVGIGPQTVVAFEDGGVTLDLVDPSQSTGNAKGVTLINVSVRMAGGDNTVRLNVNDIAEGIQVIDGGDGTDRLELEGFSVPVTRDSDGTYSLDSEYVSVDAQNDVVVIRDKKSNKEVYIKNFEDIPMVVEYNGQTTQTTLNYTSGSGSVHMDGDVFTKNFNMAMQTVMGNRVDAEGNPIEPSVSELSPNISLTFDMGVSSNPSVMVTWIEPVVLADGKCIKGAGYFSNDPETVTSYIIHSGAEVSNYSHTQEWVMGVDVPILACAPSGDTACSETVDGELKEYLEPFRCQKKFTPEL